MTFDYEQLLITNELSEIIRWHNQTLERLRAYRQNYPYLIPPNVGLMMEENLKENVQMLYRELNNLHKPKAEQRRHVCRECNQVFALTLRGGICDECRSRLAHQAPDYAAATQAAAARTDEDFRLQRDVATENASGTAELGTNSSGEGQATDIDPEI